MNEIKQYNFKYGPYQSRNDGERGGSDLTATESATNEDTEQQSVAIIMNDEDNSTVNNEQAKVTVMVQSQSLQHSMQILNRNIEDTRSDMRDRYIRLYDDVIKNNLHSNDDWNVFRSMIQNFETSSSGDRARFNNMWWQVSKQLKCREDWEQLESVLTSFRSIRIEDSKDSIDESILNGSVNRKVNVKRNKYAFEK